MDRVEIDSGKVRGGLLQNKKPPRGFTHTERIKPHWSSPIHEDARERIKPTPSRSPTSPLHSAVPYSGALRGGGLWEDDVTTVAMAKQEDRNPSTIEECRAFIAHVESLFMPWNVDALVDGFSEDCVVRFGIVPEFRGREALRAFFLARSARQKGYRLKKQFRTLMNDKMTNIWDGEWEDSATGRRMKGFGVEVWTMRGGKIAIWETAFNSGPADEALDVSQMLK
jgi:nuclear transport factor 2 (NTF2) superfamily protein